MNLKDYRESKGLTQPQLANELKGIADGIDAPLISKIEKGICDPPESVRAYINGVDPDKNKTQKERVLNYMKRFGSISTWEAFRDLGITRVGARVFELKEDGYEIETGFETGKNRYGKTVRWANYTLKEK